MHNGIPSNDDRADWGGSTLWHFADLTGTATRVENDSDCADAIADLICDLCHYAKTRGIEPLHLIERGAGMWTAEDRHPEGNPYMNDVAKLIIEHGNNSGEEESQ